MARFPAELTEDDCIQLTGADTFRWRLWTDNDRLFSWGFEGGGGGDVLRVYEHTPEP